SAEGYTIYGRVKIPSRALSVISAIDEEVKSENVDSVFHIGDISYATGFLAEWDFFLSLINPVASIVSYMTAIENHE
ncbi:hypothetical protein S83_035917, partial [Arachis hypogaea]